MINMSEALSRRPHPIKGIIIQGMCQQARKSKAGGKDGKGFGNHIKNSHKWLRFAFRRMTKIHTHEDKRQEKEGQLAKLLMISSYNTMQLLNIMMEKIVTSKKNQILQSFKKSQKAVPFKHLKKSSYHKEDISSRRGTGQKYLYPCR